MNLYEQNLEIFKKFTPDIYEELIGNTSKYDVKNIRNADEYNYIMEYNNAKCYVHSQYDIHNEMNMMYKNTDDEVETLIIFGLGCGYCLEHAKNNFKNVKNIIVIEPNINLFRKVLGFISIADISSKFETLSFVLNKDPFYCKDFVFGLIEKFLGTKIDLVYHISYRTIFSGYYEEVSEHIIKEIKRSIINSKTLDYRNYEFTYNTISNLKKPRISLDCILNGLKGVPIIIVSAGPSLNKNMHLLKEVKDRALICAVGTAIKILDNNEIIPHLRFAFDAGKIEKDLFDGLKDGPGLVYGNSLYYEVIPNYNGKTINFVTELDFLAKYIYNKAGINFETVRSGFSIANVAMDIACRFNSSMVIMMGQDLCYTNGELYAKGIDKKIDSDFSNSGFVKTTNIYGEDVYTDDAFMGMKNLSEGIIKVNPSIHFINATEGGLDILGAENKKFNEVLKILDYNVNVNNLLKNSYAAYDEKSMQDDLIKTIGAIRSINCELDLIESINNERLAMLKRLNKKIEKRSKQSRILNDIEYLKKYEMNLCEISFYNEVVLNSLRIFLSSVEVNNRYSGNDIKNKINSEIKILSGKTTIIFQYIDFIKQVLEG